MKRDRRKVWVGLVFLLLLAVILSPHLIEAALRTGEMVSEHLVKKKEWHNPTVVRLIRTLDGRRRKTAEHDLDVIGVQLMTYQALTGSYPRTEQGIAALVAKPAVQPVPPRWKQLLHELPLDPWGRSYQYERKTGLLELRSLGLNVADASDDLIKVVSTP